MDESKNTWYLDMFFALSIAIACTAIREPTDVPTEHDDQINLSVAETWNRGTNSQKAILIVSITLAALALTLACQLYFSPGLAYLPILFVGSLFAPFFAFGLFVLFLVVFSMFREVIIAIFSGSNPPDKE